MNDWRSLAACRGVDPDMFFPERGESVKAAKQTCATCTVREPCLQYAITRGERFGIWGGTSERERRRLRHARMLGLRSAAPTAVAQQWARSIFDDENVEGAWPLVARPHRRQLIAATILDPDADLVAALAKDEPDDPSWSACAAAIAKRWITAAPDDLAATAGPWRLLERTLPASIDRTVAMFVRPDDPDRDVLPEGARVPCWPVRLERSPTLGWQVAAVGAAA